MKTIWLNIFAAALLISCASQGDIAKHQPFTMTPPESSLHSQDAELAAFLPPAASLRLSARGDIDGDGDDDALIVLQNSAGDEPEFKPRKLIVLRRNPAGYLEKAVESANAILCQRCGGMMGDPLQQIRLGDGEFTLRFEGGSRELWSGEFRFVYDLHHSIWKLDEVVFSGLDRIDGKTASKRQEPKDFGDILLEEFDAASFPADALP